VDGGVDAQRFFDRAFDQRTIGLEHREQLGVRHDRGDEIGDQMARRLVARDDQEDQLRADLDVGQALAVDLGVHEPRHEVVGTIAVSMALGDQAVDVRAELGMRAVEPFAALVAELGRIGAFDHLVGPLTELHPIASGHSDEIRDHVDGHRRDEFVDQLAVARGRGWDRGSRCTARARSPSTCIDL
jgi:hypothetical protein